MTAKVTRVPGPSELTRYVEQHPVGVVVAAFGVGYLLSGALFSKATARMVGFGLRFGFRYATPSVLRAALGTPPGNESNRPDADAPAKESP